MTDLRITLSFYQALDRDIIQYLQSFENGYVRNVAVRRLLSKAIKTPGFTADIAELDQNDQLKPQLIQAPSPSPEPVIQRDDSGSEVQSGSVNNLLAPDSDCEPADSMPAQSPDDSLSPVQVGEESTVQAPSEPVALNQPSEQGGKDNKGFGDAFVDMLG